MIQPTMNTYLNHARQNQMIAQNKTVKEMMEMPVCPKCTRAGFRHKGWREKKIMVCPHCGYEGPTTHVLRAFLKEGLYK